jgi:hypothetical protein
MVVHPELQDPNVVAPLIVMGFEKQYVPYVPLAGAIIVPGVV